MDYKKVAVKFCGISKPGEKITAGDTNNTGYVSIRRSGKHVHILVEVLVDGKIQQTYAMVGD